MTNLSKLIDDLGALRASIATLELQEKALKDALADLDVGSYEGELFRLNVIVSPRDTPDQILKQATADLVTEHLSRQFITAHTVTKDVRTLRTGSRTGKAVAA